MARSTWPVRRSVRLRGMVERIGRRRTAEAALRAAQCFRFRGRRLRACGMLMRTDHAPINVVRLPIDLPGGVGFLLHGVQTALPNALLAPAVKAARTGRPRAIAARNIALQGASALEPQDAIHNRAMRTAGRPISGFAGGSSGARRSSCRGTITDSVCRSAQFINTPWHRRGAQEWPGARRNTPRGRDRCRRTATRYVRLRHAARRVGGAGAGGGK